MRGINHPLLDALTQILLLVYCEATWKYHWFGYAIRRHDDIDQNFLLEFYEYLHYMKCHVVLVS